MSVDQINCEYIETDSNGGYALGNNVLINERRYHSLYTIAKNPPVKRLALLKSLDLRLRFENKEIIFSSHAFNGKECPKNDEVKEIKFNSFPVPTWNYYLSNGIEIKQELFLKNQSLFLSWSIENKVNDKDIKLLVRPLFSGNDHHTLLKACADNVCIETEIFEDHTELYFKNNDISCNLYHNGDYSIKGFWYNNIFLKGEKDRGFDYLEDLYMPGEITYDLSGLAVLNLNVGQKNNEELLRLYKISKDMLVNERVSLEEKTRKHFIVGNGQDKTIIAGYPWFTDWGRDTFIALRGLCFAVNDLSSAENIILRWSSYVSKGMIPNRFTDYEEAEYNTVDASLWYIICCYELLKKVDSENYTLSFGAKDRILEVVNLIIENYIKGTRYNIKMDTLDGLIFQGSASKALTWMDARIDESPVTPRIGKAVEIQALWINVLKISSILLNSREDLYNKAKESFLEKFWIKEHNYFYDVINGNIKDSSFRPNQIYTIGGLPFKILDNEKAKLLLKQIGEKLLTPFGLRSLSEENASYKERCVGSPVERDMAYHQGTVWAFLIGPYLEGYLRIYDFSEQAISYVRERLKILDEIFNVNEAGQCFEIYDGGIDHSPRGCPFQAWSFSEYLRVKKLIQK